MRNITSANLISIDTGFGFVRNTDAGMGDVRSAYGDSLHLRYRAKRQHPSAAKAGKQPAQRRECLSTSACGMSLGTVCRGPKAHTPLCRRPSWCLVGPAVSPASLRIR